MIRGDYRADIDGLRAVAVVAVLLFHLNISALFGGFVGVDIFFVISGFLITGIILKNRERGKFTFSSFYLGRVRRIVPPLVATVAVTFLASAFILLPDDLVRFARSAIGALTSTSNLIFYWEAGYWDTSSELKPLLHTWSLGVEEQFYLIWPAMVILAVRLFGSRHFTTFLGGVTTVSFIGMMVWNEADPSAAFYMFPARIFQFAAGAWLGCAVRDWSFPSERVSPWLRDGLFLLGLAGVLACILLFDENTPFPGWAAVWPTLATLLLLLAGSFPGGQARLGRWVLCNPISTWFGQVSYALYLVHWPIVSLYRYETGLELTGLEQVGLAVAMLAAGAVLHYGLERRFYVRTPRTANELRLSPGAFAFRAGFISLALTAVAGQAWYSQGWVWRFPSLSISPEQIEAGMRQRFSRLSEGCRIDQFYSGAPNCNQPGATRVLVLGNSHEPDGYNFIIGGYGDDTAMELVYFGTINQCAALSQSDEGGVWLSSNQGCQARLDVFNRQGFAESLDYVVYAANQPFSSNKQSLLEMIRSIRSRNSDTRIVTIGGYINTEVPCARIVNETGSTSDCASGGFVTYFANHPERYPLYNAFSELNDVFIDRVALLCPDRRLEACLTEAPGGEPMFYDEHHLSLEFAEMSGRLYAALNPNLFARTRSDVATQDRPVEDTGDARLSEFSLSASPDGGIETMPAVSAELTDQGWRLERQGEAVQTTGGRTGVAHVAITGSAERSFSGNKVLVEVSGNTSRRTELRLQYSTNEVGNSGWHLYDIEPGDFVVNFEYRVPEIRNGRGDYLGIDPVDAPILITGVRISLADPDTTDE